MRIRMFLAALAAVWCAGAAAADPVDKINLRVLYVGNAGDARTAEFVALLGQHFTKVGEASGSDFEPKGADGYDVVLYDAARTKLPADFNRATVLIGQSGVTAAAPLKLKTDNL